MSYSPLAVATRRALLDALVGLRPHRDALVLVGAQAIYLYTGHADVAIATETKDSDIVVIPDRLQDDPVLEAVMRAAGFHQNVAGEQGEWLTEDGIPVELLVPAGLQPGSTRGARIPPHHKRAAKRVPGLEAAAFDHRRMTIEGLDGDQRHEDMNVAGPAALVIAKMHKIGERHDRAQTGARDRTIPKDAHDVYRLLTAVEPDEVAAGLERLRHIGATAETTDWAIEALRRLANTPDAPLCVMAGQAERDVGQPEDVAARTWGLVADVLDVTDRLRAGRSTR